MKKRQRTSKVVKRVKPLEELTLGEVLKKKEYYKHMVQVMQSVERQKTNVKEIAELRGKDKWNAGEMTVLYALANENKIEGMPKRLRDFIILLGLKAFKRTMVELKGNEQCAKEK